MLQMRRVRHFMLTGYKAEMKTELSHQIQSLGGVYTETEVCHALKLI